MIETLASSLALSLPPYAEELDPSDGGTDEEELREIFRTELERLGCCALWHPTAAPDQVGIYGKGAALFLHIFFFFFRLFLFPFFLAPVHFGGGDLGE